MTLTTGPGPPTERTRLSELAGELLRRDRWSRERLLGHQQKELRALIRHAVARSPYYREAFGADAADGEVQLTELPTLPKQLLMEQFDRVVTDPRLRLDDVEAHLAGDSPAALLLGDYHVFSTSGTTGLRGVFVQTEEEFSVWVAATLRALTRFGIGPDTRVVGIGAPGPLHISKKLFAALAGASDGGARADGDHSVPGAGRGAERQTAGGDPHARVRRRSARGTAASGPAEHRAEPGRGQLGGAERRRDEADPRRMGDRALRGLRVDRGSDPRVRLAGAGGPARRRRPARARGRRRAEQTGPGRRARLQDPRHQPRQPRPAADPV